MNHENLPARHTHYSRASSKHRKFLDSQLSIAVLHRQFCVDNPECIVSYAMCRCIFNQDFNISFGLPYVRRAKSSKLILLLLN